MTAKIELSNASAAGVLDAVLSTISEALARGESVSISGPGPARLPTSLIRMCLHAGDQMEEGLAAPAPVTDLRSVHDVAHPQLSGIAEGESSPVGRGGRAGTPVEQALGREQPVHRGGSKRVVDAARAGGLDELVDREWL